MSKTADKEALSMWFDKGKLLGRDFMIVVCDTFSHEDYPVYCGTDNFDKLYKSYDGVNMQKVMEVYDLSMDKNEQLNEGRAFHKPASTTVPDGE